MDSCINRLIFRIRSDLDLTDLSKRFAVYLDKGVEPCFPDNVRICFNISTNIFSKDDLHAIEVIFGIKVSELHTLHRNGACRTCFCLGQSESRCAVSERIVCIDGIGIIAAVFECEAVGNDDGIPFLPLPVSFIFKKLNNRGGCQIEITVIAQRRTV